MRKASLLSLLLLAACGGSGSTPTPPAPSPQVLSASGTLLAAQPSDFVIQGVDYPGQVFLRVIVRFTAVGGTPFDGCRRATLEQEGVRMSATEIEGTLPPFELAGDVDCVVTVVFPGGVELTSSTAIASPLGTRDPDYDHDGDGLHDRCDPDTYDFEDDGVTTRPADTSQVDRTTPGFVVLDAGGDRAAHYANASSSGVSDRFERLHCDTSHQDLTAYLDFDATAQLAHVELWSDGSYAGNSGAGLLFQVTSAGQLQLYQRVRRSLPVTAGPSLPTSGRIRLRLIKGPAHTSTLHVDAWVNDAWTTDHAVFPIQNDTWFTGRRVVMAEYGNSTRGLKRITVERHVAPAALTLFESAEGAASWKVFQRDASDAATIPVRCHYQAGAAARLEARVVNAGTTTALLGHDFSDHAVPAPATAGAALELAVTDVPTGGNYDVEVRLVDADTDALLSSGQLTEVAVGDLYLCIGQSNMAGYSGNLSGATTPISEVHLFHNNDTWLQASEPMDNGTFQRDGVSAENPLHSLMLPFAVALYQATQVPVGIIPAPLGGTNLYAQWRRNASDPDDSGTLYGSGLRRAALQGGAPLRGILWYQGESDALAGRSTAQYRADLEALVADYRTDLSAPEAVFLCVQLGTWSGGGFPHWTNVQEAQRQVCANDPLAALATVHDQARSDGIHYTVAAYQELGARLAEQARVLVFGEALDPLAELTAAVATNAGADIELRYDAAVSGGQASLFEVVDAGGPNPVLGVTSAGSTITVQLTRVLSGSATVRYGMSTGPAVAWVVDAGGVAVPAFAAVAVTP
jgi:hypothetical protein